MIKSIEKPDNKSSQKLIGAADVVSQIRSSGKFNGNWKLLDNGGLSALMHFQM